MSATALKNFIKEYTTLKRNKKQGKLILSSGKHINIDIAVYNIIYRCV